MTSSPTRSPSPSSSTPPDRTTGPATTPAGQPPPAGPVPDPRTIHPTSPPGPAPMTKQPRAGASTASVDVACQLGLLFARSGRRRTPIDGRSRHPGAPRSCPLPLPSRTIIALVDGEGMTSLTGNVTVPKRFRSLTCGFRAPDRTRTCTYGLEVRHDPSGWYSLRASLQVGLGSPSVWSCPGWPSYVDRIASGIVSVITGSPSVSCPAGRPAHTCTRPEPGVSRSE